MRKFALVAFASLFTVAALPANASLADRKSDQTNLEQSQPSLYSGQTVIRGEIREGFTEHKNATPAPYSGQIVIRGEVQTEGLG